MIGPPDAGDRAAQVLVAIAIAFCAANGTFMLIAPLDWYYAIPTVRATGPANTHFIADIGIAYLGCALILLYAVRDLRLRWLAALAGGLWLTAHGMLHIYELAVGICSPGRFWRDAPGTIGIPLLVLTAVAILFARQRIAPAGLPRGLFLKAATAKVDDSEKQYLEEVAAAPGRAFEKFTNFMPASIHRHVAPANLFHAARLGATLAEDCGPCALTGARWALSEGVSREVVNRILSGGDGLTTDEKLALDFGRAIATQSADAAELGDRIEAAHGRAVRFELAMTAAMVRAYPGMKRGLGLTKSCALTPLEI